MLNSKTFLDYVNIFSPNEYGKNDKIIQKHWQQLKRLRWKKCIALFVESTENLENLKYHTF